MEGFTSLENTIKEYDQKIVDAVRENAGDIFEHGSFIYRKVKQSNGSEKINRIRNFGK
jgi:hypothetical protein